MNRCEVSNYTCPVTGLPLRLEVKEFINDEIIDGIFYNTEGTSFQIKNGIPDFTWPLVLKESDEQTRQLYDDIAEKYDTYAALPFITYRIDEYDVRERMIDRLELKSGATVLEIGCGTGRSAPYIVQRIGGNGKLYLQELSFKLLKIAVEKLKSQSISAEFSIANGSYLSFPDNFFDAAYHFGGINTFSEISRCLFELARVVKPGGKVVVGDESLGPWLRETEMGRIMMNSNPLLKCEPPISSLPSIATDVQIEYIMMGAFYMINFRVAEAQPVPDYHVKIPSARGGSHWTRYYGQLEGVSDEAKKLAYKACEQAGLSMHDWLDSVVQAAANAQFKKNEG